jgi:short-subunit dehydrogenase
MPDSPDTHQLAGQTAIVTGASRGLGRAVAQALAARGMRVALAARDAEALAALAAEITDAGGRAIALPTDVARYAEIRTLVERTQAVLGPVEVVINNAGLGWFKPFVEHSVEELDLILDVNLRGTMYVTHAVLPAMLERRRGQILNVASDLARRPLAGLAAYAGAKHGVLGFGASVLREVKERGVRVMTLTPGIIDTYFGGGKPGRDPAWSMTPEWVADVIVWMLTAPAGWAADEVALHPLGQEF